MGITVLHINSYFFSNKLHLQLIEKLNSNNIEQLVFIPVEIKAEKQKPISFGKIRFSVSRSFNKIDRILWPLKILKIWLKILPILRNEVIEIIHAHSLMVNGSIAYLAKKFFKTPYVVTVRNSDINTFFKKSSVFKFIGYKIMKEAQVVTTLSPTYFDYHLKGYLNEKQYISLKRKHKVVPNGADDFWFNNKWKNKGIEKQVNILFIGLLAKNKNLHSVMDVCETLFKSGVPVSLHVVGEGRCSSEFKKRKTTYPVKFYGFIDEKKILLEIYRKSHLLFVPSFTESFGVVYVEALTQSIPVIYTKNQGFDGFFEEGIFGFSVNPNNKEEMVQKIRRIIKDYDSFSHNAFEYSDFFKWDNPVKTLINIYSQAI